MRKLFMSSLAVNVLVMALNLLTGILSARYLGPEGRGELATATRWSSLFAVIFTLGLPGAVIYLGKQFPEKQRDYLGIYLMLGTSMGVTGLLIGEAVLPFVLVNQSDHVIRLSQTSMLALPLMLLSDGLLGTLSTLNMFRKILVLRVLNPVGIFTMIVILLAAGEYTVSHFIVFGLFWSLGIFLITLAWVLRTIKPRIGGQRGLSRELFSKGLKIYAGFIVSTFGGNLDQLIISLFLSTYTLGLYSVSSSIGSILPSVIVGAIGTYLFPKLMDFASKERQNQVERIHGTLFYLTLALAVVGGVVLPYVLPLVYGEQYREAVLMGQILLVCAPLYVAYMVLTNYLSAEAKFHYVTIAEIAGLIVGMTVTVILLPIMHGVGAAIGVTVIALVKWGYVLYKGRALGLSLSRLMYVYPESYASIVRALSQRLRRKSYPGVAGERTP